MLGLGQRHANAAERWVDVHGVRLDAVRHPARIVIQQVGRDDLVVVVGRMRERASPIAIAQGPDAGDVGAQLLIDADIPARISLNAGLVQAEIIGIGYTPHCQQQMRARHFTRAARAIQPDHHVACFATHAQAVGGHLHVDALGFQNLAHRLRHVFIFTGDQARAFLHDRHARAEAPIHLAELQPHVAATDHDQVLGQEVHVHHGGVGQVGHLIQPRHRGNQRAPANVDEDALGLQQIVADTHGLHALKASMPLEDSAVLKAADPLLHAVAGAPGNLILAGLHACHIDIDRPIDHHAVLGSPLRQTRGVCAGDQCLGGNAPGVDTRATKPPALDDGNLHARAGQPRGQRRASLPGTDDDGVEALRHGDLLRGGIDCHGMVDRAGVNSDPASEI